jgi:hypothetical protein
MATNWKDAVYGTLMDDDQQLKLPRELESAYFDVIDVRGLEEMARGAGARQGIYGGCSDEEAKEHFACRFPNSAIRSTAAYADPFGAFSKSSSLVRRLISNGKIVILDLPAGAGAATLGLIVTAASLRQAGCLPSVPVSINVLAADCSAHGLLLMQEMLTRVDPYLRRNGIYCDLTLMPWNAQYSHETSLLFDYSYAISADHYLVITADFSGAAGGPEFSNYRDSFMTIRDRVLNKRNAYWVHVEPSGFNRADTLFKSLAAKLFSGIVRADSVVEQCEFQWRALFTGRIVPVRVQIKIWRGEESAA